MSSKKILYFECNSGISGDMAVAALLDAGADRNVLEEVIKSIPAKGFSYKISRGNKCGIDCCDFDVILDSGMENHDHDMNYLFGHLNNADGNPCGENMQSYAGDGHHEENISCGKHDHHHEHRTLSDILKIISMTEMTEGAKALAEKIFDILAEAESKAHGIEKSQVHFHEAGAIDSIVDVISLAVCFDNLGIQEVCVPYLCEGTGTVRCRHGILPIPVPAVTAIAEEYSLPLKIISETGEFVTPTGAAFIAAVKTKSALPQKFIIKKTGLGAGKRNYSRPSILRALIIEEDAEIYKDKICKLETNVDDTTGEALGFVMGELFKNGAHDVNYVPCFMKKNRPAYLLNVICSEEDRTKLEEIIFKHTTTIGIRRQYMERTILQREVKTVKTQFGEAKVKIAGSQNATFFYPEYESVIEIAEKQNLAFDAVYRLIVKAAEENFL